MVKQVKKSVIVRGSIFHVMTLIKKFGSSVVLNFVLLLQMRGGPSEY